MAARAWRRFARNGNRLRSLQGETFRLPEEEPVRPRARRPLRLHPGSIAQGLAAATRLEQTYTVAYIAHVPLEPRAAVAEWNDGKLTVWTGTQRPFGVRSELAAGVSIFRKTRSA